MNYEGKEKYIFVSYSHKDSDTVLPIIDALSAAGYRVWYDSGIEAGSEWPEYIEERLMNAQVVLTFMTPAAVESRNCRNEINFALELKKEVLVIYLEDTTLLKGMRLQLNSSQSLYRANHNSDASFINELLTARLLRDCRATISTPPQPVTPPRSTPVVPVPPVPQSLAQRPRWPLYAILGGVLAALIILICVLTLGGDHTNDPTDSNPGIADTVPVTMSDNLLDFTIKIEDVVYQLPCKYTAFAQNGWTISTSGCSDTALLAGEGTEYITFSNNGKQLSVTVYNPSGNAKAIKDCLISEVDCESYGNTNVSLAKGITPASTVDDVINAFGIPNSRNDADDYTSLTYQKNDSFVSQVRFMIYKKAEDMKYNSVSVKNQVDIENTLTETNTTRPDYLDAYTAPTALGTDFKDSTIKIGGDLYRFPAPLSCFIDNGWTFAEQPNAVKSGGSETVRMERNGAKIYLSVTNFTTYQTIPANCAVTRASIDAEDQVECELPNGIKFGLDKAKVDALATSDFSYDALTYNHYWSYSEYTERDFTVSFKVDVETNQVSNITLSCKTWDYE